MLTQFHPMYSRRFKHVISWLVIALGLCLWLTIKGSGQSAPRQERQSLEVPKTWDAEAIASIEIALADAQNSPTHISAEYYFAFPSARFTKVIRSMRRAESRKATGNGSGSRSLKLFSMPLN